MKEKLALVIAALMVTSMAFAISTTSVSTPSTFSASAPTISPSTVRDNTRVKLTIAVTNPSATDKIENVAIVVYESGQNFTQGIGGTLTAENLKLAADNLENAVAPLKRAGENLKLAAENMKAAGPDLVTAGENFMSLTDSAWKANAGAGSFPAAENVFTLVYNAGDDLKKAGQAMENDSENFTYIATYLSAAAAKLTKAAANGSSPEENLENWNPAAADNLDNAADNLQAAADNLLVGSLRQAGIYLVQAGDNLENTGTSLGGTVGTALETAGKDLQDAGLKLQDAADFENKAGYNLKIVENYLLSAGSLIELADIEDLKAAGDNLENAAAQIGFAADNMENINDNILQAGDNLSQAAIYLATAATELGADLGGDELKNAMEHENAAAENLNVGDVDLGTAGDQLIDAADDLSAAATKILATADELAPTGWKLTEPVTNQIRFNADNSDYFIAASGSASFTFLWKTPDLTDIENDYTIRIYYYKENATTPFTHETVTLTLDGKVPTLTINVTQTGVATVNLAGPVYDNGLVTVTITASEELSSIGAVTVEDKDNFIPPLTLENTNNTVFTATFTVGEWDDNTVKIKVASVKDLVGLENDSGMENTLIVDTLAPIFSDNSLNVLAALPTSTQPGTTNTYYVTENKLWTLDGIVEDNYNSADNGKWVTVTINGVTANKNIPPLENEFYMDNVELSEGISAVTVRGTDRVGNYTEDNIENVFCDNTQATFSLTQLGNVTSKSALVAADNYIYIDRADNLLTIKVTLSDTGYPTTQWGVTYENVRITLMGDDGSNRVVLDNKDVWTVSESIVWENTYLFENADNWYRLEVCVGDNITENYLENIRFRMDTTVPNIATTATWTSIVDPDDPTTAIGRVTAKANMLIKGYAQEAKSTIKIYAPDEDTLKTTVTASSTFTTGKGYLFSVSITLSEGANQKIYIQEIDLAGNESAKELLSTKTVDVTKPTITLTAPEPDTTTDQSAITVSGTITDAIADYDELGVKIDSTGAYVSKDVYLNPNGSFSTTIPLSEGNNVINVFAQDEAGNREIVTVTVTRTVTPWATYAIIIVIVALILAAIAIFRKR